MNPKHVARINEIINAYVLVRILETVKNKLNIPIMQYIAMGILAANVLIFPKIKKDMFIIQNKSGGVPKNVSPFNFKLIQLLELIASFAIKTYFVSS